MTVNFQNSARIKISKFATDLKLLKIMKNKLKRNRVLPYRC